MRNLDLERLINNMLYINCSIETYDLEKLLKEALDPDEDELDEIVEAICETIEDEARALEESLTYEIAAKIQELIEAKNQKDHPEDAPWQLHLFD